MPIGRRSTALSSMTRPKLALRPIRTTRIGDDIEVYRAQEMRGLVD
jgi:hypothetical protein